MMVRSAVATSESVFRMPALARMAVSAANSAEPMANIIHILTISPINTQKWPPALPVAMVGNLMKDYRSPRMRAKQSLQ